MEGLSTKQKISAWQDCHGCMPGAGHCPALTIKAQILAKYVCEIVSYWPLWRVAR